MSKVVPIPSTLLPAGTSNTIRNAAPVRGIGEWRSMASTSLYLLGRLGNSLVVGGPDATISAGGTATMPFYVWPHSYTIDFVWMVTIQCTGSGGASGTIESPVGSTMITWTLPGGFLPKTFIVECSAVTSAGEVKIKVLNDSASISGIRVLGVLLYEVPRVHLETASGIGVPDTASDDTGRIVYEESSSVKSLYSVMRAQSSAITQARRSCLFTWYLRNGIGTTSSSYVTLLSTKARVQPRHLYDGVNTTTIAVAVLVTSASGGHVKLTADSGDTLDLSFGTVTDAWQTGSIDVNNEDMTTLDSNGGQRGGAMDELLVEFKSTSGTTTIKAVCIGES